MNTSQNHQITVIVPSTLNGNKPADAETVAKWIKKAKCRFAQLFGGFTAHSAVGGWVSPVHGLIEEKVTVVSSFTDEAGLEKLADVRGFAASMAGALAQEAVAVQFDNSLEFVSPVAMAA